MAKPKFFEIVKEFRVFCNKNGYKFNHLEHGQKYRMAQIFNYQTSNFDLHYPPEAMLPPRMNRKDASAVYNKRIRAVWNDLNIDPVDRAHDELVNWVVSNRDRMLKREIKRIIDVR